MEQRIRVTKKNPLAQRHQLLRFPPPHKNEQGFRTCLSVILTCSTVGRPDNSGQHWICMNRENCSQLRPWEKLLLAGLCAALFPSLTLRASDGPPPAGRT